MRFLLPPKWDMQVNRQGNVFHMDITPQFRERPGKDMAMLVIDCDEHKFTSAADVLVNIFGGDKREFMEIEAASVVPPMSGYIAAVRSKDSQECEGLARVLYTKDRVTCCVYFGNIDYEYSSPQRSAMVGVLRSFSYENEKSTML